MGFTDSRTRSSAVMRVWVKLCSLERKGGAEGYSTSAQLTCGRDFSPSACIFSFISATFAAVPLLFAPLRPLPADPPALASKEEVQAWEASPSASRFFLPSFLCSFLPASLLPYLHSYHPLFKLTLIHIRRSPRLNTCRSPWSPYN